MCEEFYFQNLAKMSYKNFVFAFVRTAIVDMVGEKYKKKKELNRQPFGATGAVREQKRLTAVVYSAVACSKR